MRIILYLLIILIFTSCASVEKSGKKGELSSIFLKSNLKTIIYSASIASDQNGTSTNFTGNIKISGRDSLSLTAYGPFGVTVAKLFSDNQKFVFYNIFENFAIEGEPVEESFERAVNIKFSFDDVIRILRAEVPDNPENYEQVENSSKGEKLYRYKSKDYIGYVVTYETTNQVLQYQRKDLSGTMVSNIFYRDYTTIKGVSFPQKIILKFPAENTEVIFNVKDIKINETIESPFRFNIPSSVKKTIIR